MGVPVNLPNADYRVASMGIDDPAQDLTPLHPWFGNFGAALPKGIAGGLASVGSLIHDATETGVNWIADQAANAAGGTGTHSPRDIAWSLLDPLEARKTVQDQVAAVQDWARLDPRITGGVSQLTGSTAHGLTVFGLGSLVGSPVAGAGLLGGTTAHETYTGDVAQGIDTQTAKEHAAFAGAAAFGGAFLPFKVSKAVPLGLQGLGMQASVAGNTALAETLFGAAGVAAKASSSLAAKLATGAAINTTFGATNRFLTSELLDHAGYPEMANQYKVLDANAVISDAVLGLFFGGMEPLGERLQGLRDRAAQVPDAGLVAQALDARREAVAARGAGGLPSDLQTANLDGEFNSQALNALIRGKATDLDPQKAQALMEGTLTDPERIETHQAVTDAGTKLLGPLVDTTPTEHALPSVGGYQEIPPEVRGDLHTARQADRVNQMAADSGLNRAYWRPFDPAKETQASFIEKRIADAMDHPKEFQALYDKIPETRGGKILNGDIAEMLVVGDADPKQGLEGIEPWADEGFNIQVFRKMWADKLAALKPGSKVWTMAGAPGAGKSRVAQQLVDSGHADLVFDANGHQGGTLDVPVQNALDKGMQPHVALVSREQGETAAAIDARAHDELRTVNKVGGAQVGEAAAQRLLNFSKSEAGKQTTIFTAANKLDQPFDLTGYTPGHPDVQNALESAIKQAQTSVEVARGSQETSAHPDQTGRGQGHQGPSGPGGADQGRQGGGQAAKVDPFVQEQVNQLAEAHPDMPVEMPDGSTVLAADAPQAMADALTRAGKDAGLFDVAINCFMRTML